MNQSLLIVNQLIGKLLFCLLPACILNMCVYLEGIPSVLSGCLLGSSGS